MDVTITLEHRFKRTPDGRHWTQTAFGYSFWLHYLEVFEKVRVCARVQYVPVVPPDWMQADGPGVAFIPVPCYIGPMEYIKRRRSVVASIRAAMDAPGAFILRVPSQIAAVALRFVRPRPYALEVVGDPHDVFALGAVRHPFRPIFRYLFSYRLRTQCFGAAAVAYVTRETLQRRYPPARGTFSAHYSSAELSDNAFVCSPHPARTFTPYTVVTVGTLSQLYKGTDVLIEAVAHCVKEGLDIRLVVVGDGRYRTELEALAASRGLRQRVIFTGQLRAGAAVRAHLDQADLFALPSRTEGLPRAMIEAMALGLPCVGSTAGGIPELLHPEDMVAPGDARSLASLIASVLKDPERRLRMASRNLETARKYREAITHGSRIRFYQEVRAITEAWYKKAGL